MTDRRLFVRHASICHTLSNPKRLEVIANLRDRELSVTELASALEIGQANLSQHLSIMRQKGIVSARREGLNVFYRLSSPKIAQACDLMREVLLDHLQAEASLVAAEGKG